MDGRTRATRTGAVVVVVLGFTWACAAGCSSSTGAEGSGEGNDGGTSVEGADAAPSSCGRLTTPCGTGGACEGAPDCASALCRDGKCGDVTPANGTKDGDETDVDCGGTSGTLCADLKKCLVAGDCASSVCKDTGDGQGLRCQVPTPTDAVKNGTETDVDCGGAGNPTCATGKDCKVDGDCTSSGCNYAFKCASHRSCKRHWGGDTCGQGGAGGIGAEAWEDCCATADVTAASGPTANKAVALGKYQVTAGRMRAFMEDVNYDVRTFVQNARANGKMPTIPGDAANHYVLDPNWDMYLPTSFMGNQNADEIADCVQGDTLTGLTCKPGTEQPGIYTGVRVHLGGTIFKGNSQTQTGCFVGAPGTHAFRFPDNAQDGDPPEVNQDQYDSKSMQCIDYLVAQAFCVWDGGRLELGQEWLAAWGPGTLPWSADTTRLPLDTVGTNSYWGCRFPWATDADQSNCATKYDATTKTIEYADYKYSYEYPKLGNVDYIVFISAPGRTRGRGPAGHADIIGTNFGITSNVTWNASPFSGRHGWDGSGSWEVHNYSKTSQYTVSMLLNKYGKLGLRCAYP